MFRQIDRDRSGNATALAVRALLIPQQSIKLLGGTRGERRSEGFI